MKSFKIEQEIEINGSPAKVFAKMTGDVMSWWDHGFSENPKRITLEPKLGGRFFEEFDDQGNGAHYATVVYLEKDKKIVLNGPMGIRTAMTGVISFELVPGKAGGTLLKLSHHAVGDIADEAQKGYDAGWKKLLGTNLKKAVEG